eukprot:CCRYP_013268-RA/>CCRYP_013268-RA protein AED:0.00 eAED:0.00 QI:72/1/1/1/0/0/2/198/90
MSPKILCLLSSSETTEKIINVAKFFPSSHPSVLGQESLPANLLNNGSGICVASLVGANAVILQNSMLENDNVTQEYLVCELGIIKFGLVA